MNSNFRSTLWTFLSIAIVLMLNSDDCLAQGTVRSLPALQLRPALVATVTPQDSSSQSADSATKSDTAESATDSAAKTVTPEEEAAAAEKAKQDERTKLRTAAIEAIVFDRRPSTILALWSGSTDAVLSGEAAARAALLERPSPSRNQGFDSPFDNNDDPFGESNNQVQNIDPIRQLGQSSEEGSEDEAKSETEAADPNSVAESEEHKKFLSALKDISKYVTMGEWQTLKESLLNREILSEEESQKIFDHMVQNLSASLPVDFSHVEGLSQEMRDFLNGLMRDSRNNPGARFAEQNLMHYVDIAGLIRAVPKKMEDRQIVEISKMLKEAIASGSEFTEFLKALRDGGPDLLEPRQAALLLSMAGRELETIEFLPTI